MRSSILSAALGGLLAASGVHAVDWQLCDGAPAAKPNPAEGPAWTLGRHQPNDPRGCDTKWDSGHEVTGFQAWKTPWQILAIQFTYADQTKSPIIGNRGKVPSGGASSTSWKEGEQISNFKLWNNKGAWRQHKGPDGLGRISFTTKSGGDFNIDCGETSGDPITPDVGSGIWLGSGWQADDFIRDLMPLFLGTNQEVTMEEVIWPNDIAEKMKQMKGLASSDTTTAYIRNLNKDCDPKNCSSAWNWNPTISKTSSAAFSTLQQNTFGVSVSIGADFKFGVPGAMETTLKTNFETSYEHMKQNSTTNTLTWTQSESANQGSTPTSNLIPPQMAMNCTASSQMGSFKSEYTTKLKLRVNDHDFQITVPGTFDGTTYGNIDTGCSLVDLSKIPNGADVKNAQETVKGSGSKRAVIFTA